MGQNTIGLPKGMATALDEIARNVKTGAGAKRKYRTEDDYYNEMVNRGTTNGFGIIKDPLRKRLFNRAKERYKKDFPREHKLNTVNDMVMFLTKHNVTRLYQQIGKDKGRHEMAEKAIELYKMGKDLID